MFLEADYLESLGVPPILHDKLLDVVVYDEDRQWLFLIEAVTSHGLVSLKCWVELEEAFKDCKVGLVYVTAFPDCAEFRKNAADVAWETEVWIADNPDHMIHFNGDRFLGSQKKDILRDDLVKGKTLPIVRNIVKEYKIQYSSVKQILDELVEEGYLKKKNKTYVST